MKPVLVKPNTSETLVYPLIRLSRLIMLMWCYRNGTISGTTLVNELKKDKSENSQKGKDEKLPREYTNIFVN